MAGNSSPKGEKLNPIVPLPPFNDAERACNIGGLLQLVASFEGQKWDEPAELIQLNGQIYRAIALKGRGWDLELAAGNGPAQVRVMNGDLYTYFRVMP